MRRTLFFVGWLIAVACPAAAQPAGRRLALVVGNDAYPEARLVNARSDAQLVAQALTGLGFSVTSVFDVTRDRFGEAVRDAAKDLGADDIVVFYFAGHAVEVNGENYLFPVDFRGQGENAVAFGGVLFTDVQRRFDKAKARVLILDACRTNPFLGVRAGGGGLGRVDAFGSIIAFSAAPGQTASDAGPRPDAVNGLFASELVKELSVAGLSIREVFRKVREEVYRISGGKQFPHVSDQLLGDVVLRPGSNEALADSLGSLLERSALGGGELAVPAVFIAGKGETRKLRGVFTSRLHAIADVEARRQRIRTAPVSWDRVDAVIRRLGLSTTDDAQAFYDVRIASELGRAANAGAVALMLVDLDDGSSRVEMRVVSTATSATLTQSIVVPLTSLLPHGLLLQTTPPGAAVTLKGRGGVAKERLATPAFIDDLPAGSYDVVAELRGWSPARDQIAVVDNTATAVHLTLAPIRSSVRRWTTLAGCAAAGVSGVWALQQRSAANEHYRRYQESTTSASAVAERARAESADKHAVIATSVAGAASVACAVPLWTKPFAGRHPDAARRSPATFSVSFGRGRLFEFDIRF